MHTHEQILDVLDGLAYVLEGAAQAPDSAPTPCTDYDVAALKQHILGWLTSFADGLEDPDGNCSDPDAVTVEGDGSVQARALRSRLDAVLPVPADRTLTIGGGTMPVEMALSMILSEYLLHGWDLATATDQAWEPRQEASDAAFTALDAMLTPDFQGPGKSFATPVVLEEEASVFDHLLARSGRDPQWTA